VGEPVRFGVVGGGWRAEFFLTLAAALPDRLDAVAVATRRSEVGERLAGRWGVHVHDSPGELVDRERPDFMISSVSWAANPGIVADLVERGMPVLSETPPAPDLDGLRALWGWVGSRRLVQVAEQYMRMPPHAARLELVRRGVIGRPTSVQVSSTHLYHAVSIMRTLLGVGVEPATVHGRSFVAPLIDPRDRDDWTGDDLPRDATTVLATLDFGGSRSGLYDFTDNQWHNQLRSRRLVVRGSAGEIVDDRVVRLAGERTILRSTLARHQLGYDLDLDGYDTEHLSFEGDVVWRNPFLGLRLSDEEIAIGDLLLATAAWCREEGPPPYPLAEACQDHLLGLAIEDSAGTGQPVTTGVEAWAAG
jgi:predicted dehydrogenase